MNKKGYKGFGPGLVCQPDEAHKKQYAENTDFEEHGGDICGGGMMHYCARPLDVLEYYPMYKNGKFSEYAEVEALETPVTDDNRKYATKKLHIGAKLSFGELVNASVEYNLAKTKGSCQRGICCGNSQTGDYSSNSQTGDYSSNSQTGDYSSNSQTGNYSGNSQTGDYSSNSQTGDYSGNSQTGYRSGNSQTGYRSGNSQTGNYSGNSQTGNYSGNSQTGNYSGNSQTGDCSGSKQTGAFSGSVSTGDYCTHNAAGKQCIAVGWGRENKIKGSVRSYIALAEWGENEIINAKMVKIDGEVIKADTWYMLKNGEFVECREDK
jgi:hypothetical protein